MINLRVLGVFLLHDIERRFESLLCLHAHPELMVVFANKIKINYFEINIIIVSVTAKDNIPSLGRRARAISSS